MMWVAREGLWTRMARTLPWLGLFSSTGIALVVTLFGIFVVPRFTEVFAQLAGELPWITRSFISGYALTWLGPVMVVACWLLLHGTRGRVLAGVVGLVTVPFWAVVTLFAVYLPYLQIGSLV